jgi:hypothetical protein
VWTKQRCRIGNPTLQLQLEHDELQYSSNVLARMLALRNRRLGQRQLMCTPIMELAKYAIGNRCTHIQRARRERHELWRLRLRFGQLRPMCRSIANAGCWLKFQHLHAGQSMTFMERYLHTLPPSPEASDIKDRLHNA